MDIAWGITGAGHLLKETFSAMEDVSKENRITAFLSQSGEEVIKAYGLWDKLNAICPGDYMQEILTSKAEGKSSPTTGRFFLKRYDALVVSPVTTNTVAKIVHGISDTLVTNAVSHAVKSMTPVYICPVDRFVGESETTLPHYVDRDVCENCSTCPPEEICDQKAFKDRRIDLLKCTACGDCVSECEYSAVIEGRKATIKVREIDAKNARLLEEIEFITVIDHPGVIKELF
ncbi:MAG: dihydromethanopterin reductase (acceptor) [Candidatus Hydrothermarchaeaceae archaeon]